MGEDTPIPRTPSGEHAVVVEGVPTKAWVLLRMGAAGVLIVGGAWLASHFEITARAQGVEQRAVAQAGIDAAQDSRLGLLEEGQKATVAKLTRFDEKLDRLIDAQRVYYREVNIPEAADALRPNDGGWCDGGRCKDGGGR